MITVTASPVALTANVALLTAALRTSLERRHVLADAIRVLQRLVYANAAIEGNSAKHEAFYDELLTLQRLLDAEATRLSVESAQLYVRTHAPHPGQYVVAVAGAGDGPSEPRHGYVAPPLSGVWLERHYKKGKWAK